MNADQVKYLRSRAEYLASVFGTPFRSGDPCSRTLDRLDSVRMRSLVALPDQELGDARTWWYRHVPGNWRGNPPLDFPDPDAPTHHP